MPAEPLDGNDRRSDDRIPDDGLMPPGGEPGTEPPADAALVTEPPAPPAPTVCIHCRLPIGTVARFCPHCGTDQKPALARLEQRQRVLRHERDWATVRGVVWFYLIYLGTVMPLLWMPVHAAASAMLAVSGIDAFLILGYWWKTRTRLLPDLWPRAGLLQPTLLACGLLLVLLPLNLGYHELLRWLFTLDPEKLPSLTGAFEIAGYGLVIQLFAIAVMPAIWEEIAFRGLIQERLRGVVGTNEAIGLTAVLFAIIHVQWLSLPYLFLLGLILGILRHRSGSLLPGMALHFLHNAAVVLME